MIAHFITETNESIWRCHLWLWEPVMGVFHNFLDKTRQLIEKIIDRLIYNKSSYSVVLIVLNFDLDMLASSFALKMIHFSCYLPLSHFFHHNINFQGLYNLYIRYLPSLLYYQLCQCGGFSFAPGFSFLLFFLQVVFLLLAESECWNCILFSNNSKLNVISSFCCSRSRGGTSI